jgi:hypothetical protein
MKPNVAADVELIVAEHRVVAGDHIEAAGHQAGLVDVRHDLHVPAARGFEGHRVQHMAGSAVQVLVFDEDLRRGARGRHLARLVERARVDRGGQAGGDRLQVALALGRAADQAGGHHILEVHTADLDLEHLPTGHRTQRGRQLEHHHRVERAGGRHRVRTLYGALRVNAKSPSSIRLPSVVVTSITPVGTLLPSSSSTAAVLARWAISERRNSSTEDGGVAPTTWFAAVLAAQLEGPDVAGAVVVGGVGNRGVHPHRPVDRHAAADQVVPVTTAVVVMVSPVTTIGVVPLLRTTNSECRTANPS